MPAVSVLPLRGTGVGSVHQVSEARLLEVMASGDGMPEVDPVSHHAERGEDPVERSPAATGSKKTHVKDDMIKPSDVDKKDNISSGGTVSPSQSSSSYPHALPSHLTPQQPGYYVAYQSQVTPEPPSPAGPGIATVYDVGSFLHQPTGFSPFNGHHYVGGAVPGQVKPGQAPPSPSQSSIPPASPLFPRVTGQAGLLDPHRMLDGSVSQQRGAPLSPGPPYLSTALGPSAVMYPAMNGANSIASSEGVVGWGDSHNHQLSPYPQSSPQISAQGIPIPYVPGMPPRSASAAGRSYSFEDNMLPPSDDSQQELYALGQTSPGAGTPGTLFAHQQAWGYGAPPPDMYGASASPLQPRPTMPYMGMPGPPRHHGPPTMGPYGGQFFQATSPGPPIQTTASNKGPDGANLFIFHIPNHFTNLDMYQLFCPYGNLLSVRIMVEKDSGRSRGFGFVSYDSPEAAALAIKELNGFAIGNKRLKVQHKQIRPSDQHQDRSYGQSYDGTGGSYGRGQMNAFPPSGPMGGPPAGWFGPHDDGMGGGAIQDQDPNDVQDTDGAIASDPLSGLEPMRQALPEVGDEN